VADAGLAATEVRATSLREPAVLPLPHTHDAVAVSRLAVKLEPFSGAG
jgi:hypothetical protein